MPPRIAETPVATLPRERLELLTELAVALQKTAIYPVTHPLLVRALERLEERLVSVIEAGAVLTLGVARDRILLDGVPVGDDRPLVAELARKLYRQQVAGVRGAAGVTREELAGFLAAITEESADDERPLGLRGPEALQRWEHIRLKPLTFQELELVEDAAGEEPVEGESGDENGLWMGLVQATLARSSDDTPADPDDVVRSVNALPDRSRDRAIANQMAQIVEKLEMASGAHAERLRRRLSRIVRGMQPQTLQRILSVHGDDRLRADFAARASNVLAADAVVDVVQAVANVSGQTISHSFLRLLKKMAAHAEETGGEERAHADGALRAQVQQLIGSWQLADPNPDEYTRALESIAATRSLVPEVAAAANGPMLHTPERIVQLSLEVGVVGPPTLRALDALKQREDHLPLLEIIAAAPAGAAQDELESYVASPRLLRRLLGRGNVPVHVLERLVARLGELAIEPLIEEYMGAEEPSVDIATTLVNLGGNVGDAIVAEFQRARPLEQRRLLLLLDRLPEWPAAFEPVTAARSPDPAVRREAVKLMVRRDSFREEGMLLGLDDPDERVLGQALGAALRHARPSLAPLLLRRLEDDTLSPELRALLVRALAATRDEDAMRWLARSTMKKVWLVGGARLRDKTPELLAALEGLATHWSHAVEAAMPLALAARSTDPEIRATVDRIRAA